MNLPNKLTIMRICLVPVVVALLLVEFPFHWLLAMLVFLAASITDMLDGKIARKRGLVTDFGKFADPLADKMLVFAVLLCLLQQNLVGVLVVIVLLLREFLVMGVRLSAATGGKVVAASFWAKAKTATQMIALVAILLLAQVSACATAYSWTFLSFLTMDVVGIVSEILLWITAVFSVVSGVQYVLANRSFILDTK